MLKVRNIIIVTFSDVDVIPLEVWDPFEVLYSHDFPVIKVSEVCEFKSSTWRSLTINYKRSQCSDEISAFRWLEMIN